MNLLYIVIGLQVADLISTVIALRDPRLKEGNPLLRRLFDRFGVLGTLSQANGTVNASYLTIKDINATGGATWNAFTTNNNVDSGNNTGWDFSFQTGRYIYTRRKNKAVFSLL